MSTTLGGRGGWFQTVKNAGSNPIQRARAVILNPLSGTELARIGDEYVMEVLGIAENGTGAESFAGVSQTVIEPGGVGVICIQGITLVETDGTLTFNDDLEVSLTATEDGIMTTGTASPDIGAFLNLADLTDWTELDFGTASQLYGIAAVDFLNTGVFAAGTLA